MHKLRVVIKNIDGIIYDDLADIVIMKTVDGEIGIMANHIPMMAELKKNSSVKIKNDGQEFDFEINDAVTGKENDPAWETFFIQAISDFLLKDEVSPGEIDNDEAAWLVEKIGADGQVDGTEKALLENLKKEAKSFPASLAALL